LDFREILKALRLIFVERTRDNSALTDFAIEAFNYIDNVLRLRRNRYVHDIWGYDCQAESVSRTPYTPTMSKPPSREPRDWSPMDIHSDESLDDVWATVREVDEHSQALKELQDAFNPGRGAVIARLLQSPPSRRFQRPQGETPSPSGTD